MPLRKWNMNEIRIINEIGFMDWSICVIMNDEWLTKNFIDRT